MPVRTSAIVLSKDETLGNLFLTKPKSWGLFSRPGSWLCYFRQSGIDYINSRPNHHQNRTCEWVLGGQSLHCTKNGKAIKLTSSKAYQSVSIVEKHSQQMLHHPRAPIRQVVVVLFDRPVIHFKPSSSWDRISIPFTVPTVQHTHWWMRSTENV